MSASSRAMCTERKRGSECLERAISCRCRMPRSVRRACCNLTWLSGRFLSVRFCAEVVPLDICSAALIAGEIVRGLLATLRGLLTHAGELVLVVTPFPPGTSEQKHTAATSKETVAGRYFASLAIAAACAVHTPGTLICRPLGLDGRCGPGAQLLASAFQTTCPAARSAVRTGSRGNRPGGVYRATEESQPGAATSAAIELARSQSSTATISSLTSHGER